MNTAEKSLIVTLIILVIISVTLVNMTLNKSEPVAIPVSTNVFQNTLTASSSQEEIKSVMTNIMSLAKTTNKISLSEKCQPDIPVAKMTSSSSMTFVNQSRSSQEIMFGSKSFVIKANSDISLKLSDILPVKSIAPKGIIVKNYGCVGKNNPAGFILVSSD